MTAQGLLLLIPEKGDPERDALAAAFVAAGGKALRLDRFWEPPALEAKSIRLYGNETFCLVLALKFGLTLVSPADDLLLQLPQTYLRRHIRSIPLADIEESDFPRFVKPLVPKQFRAAIYRSRNELLDECQGLDGATLILVSDIVEFTAEARAFILDGRILDVALYEGAATLPDALPLIEATAKHPSLPPTCVIDVGFIRGKGWAVIEANAAWGAGLNGCSAEKVLPAILVATHC